MFDTERWGVVHANHKYILETATGTEELYDLATDPGEHVDLAMDSANDLGPWRTQLAAATGGTIAHGWRLNFAKLTHPVSVKFRRPIDGVGVIDPEAQQSKRANLEWGERPPVRAEEVASVTLDSDGQTVHIVPGTSPKGIVTILGPGKDDLAMCSCEDRGVNAVRPGKSHLCGDRTYVVPGPILTLPPPDSDALRTAPDADVIDALEALGYIEK